MTYLRLCALLTIILVFSGGCACYAQKTTVDPNLARASKPLEDDTLDTRLSQKVTYEAWHTPLKTIIEDISKSTGVTLVAGYNKNDWQVRDRRMNIDVNDVTLAQLMNSIARVMHFQWSKDKKDNVPVYRLIADRKLLGALQTESNRLDNELKAEEIRRRTGLVEALAKVADLSGPDLLALKQTNPYLYQCAESGFAKMMTTMFTDEPKLREAFVSGNKAILAGSNQLSQSVQEHCTSTMRKNWTLGNIIQKSEPLPDNLEEDFPKREVHLSWINKPAENAQRKRLFYFGCILALSSDGLHFMGDMRDPYAKSSQAWGRSCLESVEKGAAPGTGWGGLKPGYFESELEEAKDIERYLMFDDVVEHPDEPDLHKIISLTMSEEKKKALMEEIQASGGRAYPRIQFQALQEAIGEAAKMSIVSDSYNAILWNNGQHSEKDELVAMLDKFADLYRCNWEKHGSILEFQRRDWFRRRASQVPDEWIKPWRDELEKNSILSFDSYVRMVVLTEDQIEENINSDQLLDQVIGNPWDYSDKQGFCRLYLQLSETQRKMLYSEPGLDLRSLTPNQWQLYSNIFDYGWQRRWITDEFTNLESGQLIMKLANNTNADGSTNNKFTVCLTKDDGSLNKQDWVITLRKIVKQDKTGKAVTGK